MYQFAQGSEYGATVRDNLGEVGSSGLDDETLPSRDRVFAAHIAGISGSIVRRGPPLVDDGPYRRGVCQSLAHAFREERHWLGQAR